jgi:hypothetical protein
LSHRLNDLLWCKCPDVLLVLLIPMVITPCEKVVSQCIREGAVVGSIDLQRLKIARLCSLQLFGRESIRGNRVLQADTSSGDISIVSATLHQSDGKAVLPFFGSRASPNKVPLRPLLDPNNCSGARRTMFVYPARGHTALCLTQAFGAMMSAPVSPRVAFMNRVL